MIGEASNKTLIFNRPGVVGYPKEYFLNNAFGDFPALTDEEFAELTDNELSLRVASFEALVREAEGVESLNTVNDQTFVSDNCTLVTSAEWIDRRCLQNYGLAQIPGNLGAVFCTGRIEYNDAVYVFMPSRYLIIANDGSMTSKAYEPINQNVSKVLLINGTIYGFNTVSSATGVGFIRLTPQGTWEPVITGVGVISVAVLSDPDKLLLTGSDYNGTPYDGPMLYSFSSNSVDRNIPVVGSGIPNLLYNEAYQVPGMIYMTADGNTAARSVYHAFYDESENNIKVFSSEQSIPVSEPIDRGGSSVLGLSNGKLIVSRNRGQISGGDGGLYAINPYDKSITTLIVKKNSASHDFFKGVNPDGITSPELVAIKDINPLYIIDSRTHPNAIQVITDAETMNPLPESADGTIHARAVNVIPLKVLQADQPGGGNPYIDKLQADGTFNHIPNKAGGDRYTAGMSFAIYAANRIYAFMADLSIYMEDRSYTGRSAGEVLELNDAIGGRPTDNPRYYDMLEAFTYNTVNYPSITAEEFSYSTEQAIAARAQAFTQYVASLEPNWGGLIANALIIDDADCGSVSELTVSIDNEFLRIGSNTLTATVENASDNMLYEWRVEITGQPDITTESSTPSVNITIPTGTDAIVYLNDAIVYLNATDLGSTRTAFDRKELTIQQPISLTPAMTSNTTPAPYVASASSSYGAGTGWLPYSAFDKSYASSTAANTWASAANTFSASTREGNEYLQIFMGNPKKVTRYGIRSRNDAGSPTDWRLLGSNDGINFEEISNITDSTPIPLSGVFFNVSEAALFSYYRLNITKLVPGVNTFCTVVELELYGYDD